MWITKSIEVDICIIYNRYAKEWMCDEKCPFRELVEPHGERWHEKCTLFGGKKVCFGNRLQECVDHFGSGEE